MKKNYIKHINDHYVISLIYLTTNYSIINILNMDNLRA